MDIDLILRTAATLTCLAVAGHALATVARHRATWVTAAIAALPATIWCVLVGAPIAADAAGGLLFVLFLDFDLRDEQAEAAAMQS